MYQVNEINGKGIYIIAVDESPFVIKVVVLNQGAYYRCFVDTPNSIPGEWLAALAALLTAVYQRIEALNHR